MASSSQSAPWLAPRGARRRSAPWFDASSLRDDRAEAFATRLPEGFHEFAYTARATTPGVFVAPPARLEEMYDPETSGRSSTDVVVVEVEGPPGG